MTHVLFLLPTLHGGGAERVMLTVLRHFDRSRFRISFAVVNATAPAYLKEIPADVELIDLRCSRVRYAIPRLVRLIWRQRPDIVFSTLGHLNLALAALRPVLPGNGRYVARETVVVTENLGGYPYPGVWRSLYRTLYRRFDAVVCQSRDMRDDLVLRLGLPDSKAVVINNPVDLERVRALSVEDVAPPVQWPGQDQDPTVRLLAAGRLVHQKGFDLLLNALATVTDVRARLVILGEGELRPSLQEQARRLGLTDRVKFAGFHANPYPYFARADAFVLSSRYEGFPNVVLEAMACGTPVIALPAPGGVREILEDIPECVIADEISSTAMAKALATWCAGSRRRVPRERLERYDSRRVVRRFEALFEQTHNSAPIVKEAGERP